MPRITVDVSEEVNERLEEIGTLMYWSKSTSAAWIIGNALRQALTVAKTKNKIRNADKIGGKKK